MSSPTIEGLALALIDADSGLQEIRDTIKDLESKVELANKLRTDAAQRFAKCLGFKSGEVIRRYAVGHRLITVSASIRDSGVQLSYAVRVDPLDLLKTTDKPEV